MINFDSINGTARNTTKNSTGELDKLSNDDFLKLFLQELKYQDPLEPMDSAKMLDSTLQMSTIESQEKQTNTLDELLIATQNPDQSQYINMIGNNVVLNNSEVNILGGAGQFKVDMVENYEGSINLIDNTGKTVYSKDISGNSGLAYINFSNVPKDGNFTVKFNVSNAAGRLMEVDSNKFSVKGVKLNNGEIEYKIADDFYINNKSVLEYII